MGDFLNFILAALELERDEVACTHNNTLQCAMTCSLDMYCIQYIKHERGCFIQYTNTEKRFEKKSSTRL